jgi:hypothetical protein
MLITVHLLYDYDAKYFYYTENPVKQLIQDV